MLFRICLIVFLIIPGVTVVAQKPAAKSVVYECPMHPDVTSTKRSARCPKCGMNLRAVKKQNEPAPVDEAPAETASFSSLIVHHREDEKRKGATVWPPRLI